MGISFSLFHLSNLVAFEDDRHDFFVDGPEGFVDSLDSEEWADLHGQGQSGHDYVGQVAGRKSVEAGAKQADLGGYAWLDGFPSLVDIDSAAHESTGGLTVDVIIIGARDQSGFFFVHFFGESK